MWDSSSGATRPQRRQGCGDRGVREGFGLDRMREFYVGNRPKEAALRVKKDF